MKPIEITNDVYYVGILNPNLRVFDVIMSTDFGTSYNSYIVKGNNKTALIEGCHKTYSKQFLNNIKEVIDPSTIDYIILNHNEPDHTGCIVELLEHMPNAQIVASQAGSIYIKNITNIPSLSVMVAKDGEELDLGGKTLKFISAPFLHWPDSMLTWLKEDNTLFSCDFLGAHYCEPYILDTNVTYPEKYKIGFKNYYDAIFGPFKPYVLSGLDKIKDLDIHFACTSHGPVLSKDGLLPYVLDIYREWSQPHKNPVLTTPIFYTSAYGNTKLIAKAIKEGILSVDATANVELFDIIEHDMGMLTAALNSSDAFAIGTPTINRDALAPVWQLLSHVDAVNNAKKNCLVFGSYGWSGEGVPNIVARLKGIKLNVYGDGLKVIFVPTQEDLENAKTLGAEFASELIGK